MSNIKWSVRYVPITHEYIITDDTGNLAATIKAVPGTEHDRIAARLMAAAPDLFVALWLLLGDEESPDSSCMSREEKQNFARQALKSAGGVTSVQHLLASPLLRDMSYLEGIKP